MKRFILLFLGSIGIFGLHNNFGRSTFDTIAPKVFLIGENDAILEAINKEYPSLLLTVCDNDMNAAWDKWMRLLNAMESHATKINYNINGLKLWLNIYWNKSGKIEHIAYYLKPNSRNTKTEELTAFFISFIKNYQIQLSFNSNYFHNGSAAFPTHFVPSKN